MQKYKIISRTFYLFILIFNLSVYSQLNAVSVTNIYAPTEEHDHSVFYDGTAYGWQDKNNVLYVGDYSNTSADHRVFFNFPLVGVDTNSTITAATLFINQKQNSKADEWPIHFDHIYYSNVYDDSDDNTGRSNRYHLNLPRHVITSNFFMINNNGETVGSGNFYRIPCTTQIQYVMNNPKGYVDNGTSRIFQVRVRDNSSVSRGAVDFHLKFYPLDSSVTNTIWPYVRVYYDPIPLPPSSVTATNDPLDYTVVRITWSDSLNEASYKLFRSTNSSTNTATNIASPNADITNYTDNNIITNRTYYYWVKAYNLVGGESAFSAFGSAFARIPALPDPPALVMASVIGAGNTIEVSWSNVADETSYTLFRNLANDTNNTTNIAGLSKNATNHQDPGLAGATEYFYWLKAYNIIGSSGYSAVSSNTTGSNMIPVKPVLSLSFVNNMYDSPVKIEWNNDPIATKYLVYRSMTNNPASASLISSNLPPSTNYIDSGLAVDTTYYYWAESYNGTNTAGFSTVVSNSTGQSIMLKVISESLIGEKRAVLKWENLPSAINYRVYRGTSPVRSPQVASLIGIRGPGVTNFTDVLPEYNKTYYYNVGYTVNGTDYILDSPAEKFLAVAVKVNDMKFEHRIELVPVYQDLISQAIPNPAPPWNPLISGDLVAAYKFRVYKVGSLPSTILVRDYSSHRSAYGDALRLVDGKITDADYGDPEDNKPYHWGVNDSPTPTLIFDFFTVVNINRVTITGYDSDSREWKEIAFKTSRFLEGPFTAVTNVEDSGFSAWAETVVDFPVNKRSGRYVKLEIVDSDDIVVLAEVKFEIERYIEEVSPETISLQNKIDLVLPFSDFNDNNIPEIYDTAQDINTGAVNDLAVFMLGSGRWNYLGGTVDSVNNTIAFDSQNFGVFGIFPADKSKLARDPVVFNQKWITPDKDNQNEEIIITINPPGQVKADFLIFNLSGKLVRTLVKGQSIDAPFSVQWDGRDDFSRRLPAGPYLYELRFDDEKEMNGLMLIVR